MIYETNFKKIEKLFPFLNEMELGDHKKLYSNGYMDLSIEIQYIQTDENGLKTHTTFSMAHYHEQNGDLVSDPDMVLKVYWNLKMVEAIEFSSQSYYQRVYSSDGKMVNMRQKKEQNSFLRLWLNNIKAQGHKICNEIGNRSFDLNAYED